MRVSDDEARVTFHVLSRLFEDYEWNSREFATLVEARRLLEVELGSTGRGELANALHEEGAVV